MGSISSSTAVEAFSAHAIETEYEDFDSAVVASAKNRVLDVIGSAIGGANASGNAELVDLIKDWGGKQEATILIHGA